VPDSAVVLVAAFGGGLAGAVLQPVISYVLETIRRKEEAQEDRKRYLRRMIEEEFNWGRDLVAASKEIARREADDGHHPPRAERLTILKEIGEGRASWQNWRIRDRSLRNKVEAYLGMARDVREHLAQGPMPDPGEPPYRELMAGLRGMERLEVEIMKRLDKLNWPDG
jgi:hypothetical protein